MKEIFVSHAAKDASALYKLKNQLSFYGVNLFLAHEDLQTGIDFKLGLKAKIEQCDTLLYISSREAETSKWCQQEIGMAYVLGKQIIWVSTEKEDNYGFIGDIQAIKCRSVQDIGYTIFGNRIFTEYLLDGGISHTNSQHAFMVKSHNFIPRENIIVLDKHKYRNWNDYGYKTKFDLYLNGIKIGRLKICHLNLPIGLHISDFLLGYFPLLGNNMYSVFVPDSEVRLTENFLNFLKNALNDLSLPKFDANRNLLLQSEVIKNSLHRSDGYW